MAVVLRLSRAGAKKAPFYHVVAADSRKPRDGAFLEQIGTWNPGTEAVNLDAAKLDKWLKNGALPTDTVKQVIKRARAAAPKA